MTPLATSWVVRAALSTPTGYDGQQFDSLTGLYDLRARYYDPTTGRFLSRDTASIDFSNPVELNRYSYAEDDPVNLTDPSGHASLIEYALAIVKTVVLAVTLAPPLIQFFLAAIPVAILAVILYQLLGSSPGTQAGPGAGTQPEPGPAPQPQPGGASGQPPTGTPPAVSPCPPDQPGPRASNEELEQGAQQAKQWATQQEAVEHWGAADWEFDLRLSRTEGYGPLTHPYIRRDQNNNPICYDTRYYLIFENQITGDLYKISANFCSIERVWDTTEFHPSTFQP